MTETTTWRPKVEKMIRAVFKARDSALLPDVPLRGGDGLGGFDLEIIELVMALQDHFDVEITDAEDEALRTVGDVFDLMDRKLGVIA